MKTTVTLNTIEIEQAISQYVCKRYPNMCVATDGVTIAATVDPRSTSGVRIPMTATVELVQREDLPDAFGRHDG